MFLYTDPAPLSPPNRNPVIPGICLCPYSTVFDNFFKLLYSFCAGCEEDPVHADAECTILARGPRPHFRREEDFGGKNREEEKAGESDASATAASDASATAYHAILPLRLLLLQDRERRESTFQNVYHQFFFNQTNMYCRHRL